MLSLYLYLLGHILLLTTMFIRLIAAIRRRDTTDIVYWTFLLIFFGSGFWLAVRKGPTLLPEEPDWLEALVSTFWFVGGLAGVIWAIKKARERRTDATCVNEHANTP